jgi:hypothetical protein
MILLALLINYLLHLLSVLFFLPLHSTCARLKSANLFTYSVPDFAHAIPFLHLRRGEASAAAT